MRQPILPPAPMRVRVFMIGLSCLCFVVVSLTASRGRILAVGIGSFGVARTAGALQQFPGDRADFRLCLALEITGARSPRGVTAEGELIRRRQVAVVAVGQPD